MRLPPMHDMSPPAPHPTRLPFVDTLPCTQGSELTPAAEAAFTEIFKRHSVNSGMDIRDMVSKYATVGDGLFLAHQGIFWPYVYTVLCVGGGQSRRETGVSLLLLLTL